MNRADLERIVGEDEANWEILELPRHVARRGSNGDLVLRGFFLLVSGGLWPLLIKNRPAVNATTILIVAILVVATYMSLIATVRLVRGKLGHTRLERGRLGKRRASTTVARSMLESFPIQQVGRVAFDVTDTNLTIAPGTDVVVEHFVGMDRMLAIAWRRHDG